MSRAERMRCKAQCHPYALNALLAAFLLLIATMISYHARNVTPSAITPGVLLVESLVFAALAFRNAWPGPVLLITLLGTLGVLVMARGGSPAAFVAVLLAVYTVALRSDRRTAVTLALVVGPLLVAVASIARGSWMVLDDLSLLGWIGFAAAVGDAVRIKKAYVAAVVERARRAEVSRDEEAGRRVIEERLRIARELHDVVAHHIAVIHVQAGVVGHLMTDQPEAARQALGHVRRSSRTVLAELGGLLDVLRQPDDPISPTDPAPGLDGLDSLIDSFAACGLKVDWELRGTRRPLPSAVDLVAYRLVQEGLTNAHKHGTGSATLGVAFEGADVSIDIVNPSIAAGLVPQVPGAGRAETVLDRVGGGYGLLGMRERARAVGGSVRAVAQSDGTWRLTARLPLQTVTT